MSRADWTYLKTTNKILKDGSWDTNEVVRPKWLDGTPAHTAKIFGVNNVYNLAKEFPIVTLRYTNWKAAIDEILWIWQLKSNNVKDLHSKIWNEWADKNGSIGKAYGWQVAQKSKYKINGEMVEMDQIDMVIHYLKNQPAFRSIVTELFVHHDLHEMGLYPCVHGMQFDVTKDENGNRKLNLLLTQRSNDTLAAGSWNVVQYAALVYMLAQVCDMQPGELSHVIGNSHLYDRHMPFIVDITLSRAKMIEQRMHNIDFNEICNMFSSPKSQYKFEEFMTEILSEELNYDNLIYEAKRLEGWPTNYEEYVKRVVDTVQFKRADKIVKTMSKYPDFDEALGFKKPKLIMNPTIKDFYQFKSPLKFNEDGKVVDNGKSSFAVTNYHYQEEGVKLQERVPVAK